ncbi:MAG TPA: DUF1810 domain-containing protein [Stellaceae bacterium]|nr:DUF1810 domain-containing protein [Stellaceae bacterium]
MSDPFDLKRFVEAQDMVWDDVRRELAAGQKQSHWMWYVFPQIAGLGFSPISEHYAIASLDEARAYLAHPVLGPRLRHCTELVNAVDGRPIGEILGSPDDLKFRSSMTLFSQVTEDNAVFWDALAKYYGGETDRATLERM